MNYIVVLALLFGSFRLALGQALPVEDPFAEGFGPRNCDQIPWSLLINQNVLLDGKLIKIEGWLKVVKVDEKLAVTIHQDLESAKAGFKQNSIRLKITDKTFNSYKNGGLEDWLKLNERPVLMFGYFSFAQDWLDGNPIGFFNEPVWIFSIGDDLQGEINIKTRGVKWR
jgi:hypothetical protein